MPEISFKLDIFEGPLDLLLFLISKHKLNIEDIEISLLLKQYMHYIDNIPDKDLESAGEFLEMAAKLIYIKTVSLLPSHEEAAQLKKELEGTLIEYSLCKKAAVILNRQYIGSEVFVRKPAKIDIDMTYDCIHDSLELARAYEGLSVRAKDNLPPPVSAFKPIVSKKIVSVTSKIIYILKRLYTTGTYEMDKLYENITNKSEKIATFLAVLELTKSGRITLNEDNTELNFIRQKKKVNS